MDGSLLTLLSLLLLVLQTGGHERRHVAAPRRYCGDKLTSSLSVLCNGYYKRVPSATNYIEYEDLSAGGEAGAAGVFRMRRDVLSMTRDRMFRQRRGVASECCHKPCTLSELMTYCGKLED